MDDPDANSTSHRWLAYELHDGLLQWLVGARMGLELALGQPEAHITEIQQPLQTSLDAIESALEEGRELIRFLDSEDVAEVSLSDTIRNFADKVVFEIRQAQQTIDVRSQGKRWPSLPSRTVWNLMRIAQQSIRNAVQHAGTCEIQVVFGWNDSEHPRLVIHDNGCGFDPAESLKTYQFGRAGMLHRAQLIGAAMQVLSTPGQGTTIQVDLPLPPTSETPT